MRAGVPLYVHPNTSPVPWAVIATGDYPVDWVVLNQSSGPGSTEDTDLYNAAREIRDSGIRVLGYIALNYGGRDDFFNNQDADTYVTRGITSAFLDQCPTDPTSLNATAQTVLRQREKGMEYVVLNPGAIPAQGYCDIADQIVLFEGDPEAFRQATFPAWMGDYSSDRFAALVHGVPSADVAHEMINLARTRRIATIFCHSTVFASGVNTWDGLPTHWTTQARILASRTA